MAWNPSPKVQIAREIGAKFRADQIIILAIDQAVGTIEAISWGKTRQRCAEAKALADIAYDAVLKEFERS